LLECTQVNSFVLLIDDIHVSADHIDSKVRPHASKDIDNVVVLSKHYSNSGRPAMTAHPIGVTTGTKIGEEGKSGGRFGSLVPPHPRMASVVRSLTETAASRPRLNGFDITFEATHHGPLFSLPTMYVEIGSSEVEWADPELAEIWMSVLDKSLFDPSWDPSEKWMICIGGGHYAPRHKDVTLRSDVDVGHILPTYSLPSESDDNSQANFLRVLDSAVKSMRSSRPDAEIISHFDRKSMNAWQRNWISSRLSQHGIDVLRGNQIMNR
jgi:D-aminoacyl-tRNA deacylase